MSIMTEVTIFVLAAFVGFEVISKVPTTLHTPLMSQTNAIHGIVMLGGLIVVGYANDPLEYVIGTIAIAFGTINVVGGFMVTDRMLGMFSRKPRPAASSAPPQPKKPDTRPAELQGDASAPAGEPGGSPDAGAAGSEERRR
jgi:proton-translocating NAD(P)+ transhydrogenase subunit alpha